MSKTRSLEFRYWKFGHCFGFRNSDLEFIPQIQQGPAVHILSLEVPI
jgi:hypothetical protein